MRELACVDAGLDAFAPAPCRAPGAPGRPSRRPRGARACSTCRTRARSSWAASRPGPASSSTPARRRAASRCSSRTSSAAGAPSWRRSARSRRLRTLAALVGAGARRTCSSLGADALQPPFATPFDTVLLDAPCSGLGTLARHPDIRWRLRADDLPRQARRQGALLESLAPLVRAGRAARLRDLLVRAGRERRCGDGVPRPAIRTSACCPCPTGLEPSRDGPYCRTLPEERRRRRVLRGRAARADQARGRRDHPFVVVFRSRRSGGRDVTLSVKRFAVLLSSTALLVLALAGHRGHQRAHHHARGPHFAGGRRCRPWSDKRIPEAGALAARQRLLLRVEGRRNDREDPGRTGSWPRSRPPGSTLKSAAQHPGLGQPRAAAADRAAPSRARASAPAGSAWSRRRCRSDAWWR